MPSKTSSQTLLGEEPEMQMTSSTTAKLQHQMLGCFRKCIYLHTRKAIFLKKKNQLIKGKVYGED